VTRPDLEPESLAGIAREHAALSDAVAKAALGGVTRPPVPSPLIGTESGYVVVTHDAGSEWVVGAYETYPEAKAYADSFEYRDDRFVTVHGTCPFAMDPKGYCGGAL
jgi:hypothetical protein